MNTEHKSQISIQQLRMSNVEPSYMFTAHALVIYLNAETQLPTNIGCLCFAPLKFLFYLLNVISLLNGGFPII